MRDAAPSARASARPRADARHRPDGRAGRRTIAPAGLARRAARAGRPPATSRALAGLPGRRARRGRLGRLRRQRLFGEGLRPRHLRHARLHLRGPAVHRRRRDRRPGERHGRRRDQPRRQGRRHADGRRRPGQPGGRLGRHLRHPGRGRRRAVARRPGGAPPPPSAPAWRRPRLGQADKDRARGDVLLFARRRHLDRLRHARPSPASPRRCTSAWRPAGATAPG